VPENVASTFANNKIAKTLTEWKSLGLQTINGQPWPEETLQAELIRPLGGPDFLIFNNFKVLMKWNHSVYYVGSVGFMAEKICGKPLYN
jgi:membrane-bound lytic murein transglycosylase B